MHIKRIYLKNFRNYSEQEIILENNINIFFGENGEGKTNVLESIFLCSIGKSFRTKKEKELIKFNEEKAIIEIEYKKIDRDGKIKIVLGPKKEIYINEIKVKRLSQLLGNINVVLFSPDDINILKNGPSNRRRFLNILISQLKPKYLYILNLYLKALEQRNNYLRQIKLENKDRKMLEIWNEKIAEYGIEVYKYRAEFIEKILEKINKIHREITDDKELIKIKYSSDCKCKEKFLEILKKNENIDIIKGYTSNGIHRDDFTIYINDKQVNVYGSQGQHRTVILSLKLAELEIISDEIGEYPILLLDDFMSELDQKRRNNFINHIENTQIFITCTEKIDISKSKPVLYKVENGKIIL